MAIARLALLGVVCLTVAAVVHAEAPVGIQNAVYVPKTVDTPVHVEVVFDASFETTAAVTAAQDKVHYRIVDLYGGTGGSFEPREIPISRVVVPTVQGLPVEQLSTVQLFLTVDLPDPKDDRYILIVSGLSIGKKAVAVSTSPARVTMTMATPTALTPMWVKAKDKDASDLFYSGALSRSANADFFGSADIKVRYPAIERTFGKRLHVFSPTFDLATSANPDADPDSLKIGFSWQFHPVKSTGRFWPITRWENAVDHEASRNFDYRTVVWRSEVLLLPPAVNLGKDAWFWINPIGGIAAGSILEVPDDAFDEGALFRLLGGVSATLEFPVFFGKTFSLQGEYQMRRQFQEEIVGKLTLGNGPHPWTSAKAEVAFNDYVSFGATFQDGEQAPKYEAVNSSLTFSLTFKAARKNKPQ